MRNAKLRRLVLQTSEGLLSTATDLVLFQIYLFGSSFGKANNARGYYRIFREASDTLEEVNYKTFQQIFYQLKRKGLIETIKDEAYFRPKITKQGSQKLNEILPQYRKKRPWDKRIYLVTYDVSEERKDDRDLLRETLKKIGCGYLQDSVWVTPYNPKGILEDFVEEHGLHGSVIVSDTGTDGAVGNRSLKELIREVYGLDELNERYKDFLQEFSGRGKKASADKIASRYLSILTDDPQLPFELLPLDWRGDEAFEFYEGGVS
jgi:phenylacetic acid degradation operon negative regulatory protein